MTAAATDIVLTAVRDLFRLLYQRMFTELLEQRRTEILNVVAKLAKTVDDPACVRGLVA